MIKKGSNIKVLTGKDKNKNGEVMEIDRKNLRAKDMKRKPENETKLEAGHCKN